MDIGSIFLLMGIFILVTLYVTRPFLVRRTTLVTKTSQTLSALLSEKERLLSALQELDLDYHLGKIPADEYPQERQDLLNETALVLRQIDALNQVQDNGQRVDKADQLLANQSSSHRPVVTDASPDDELEALIAARRRERIEKAAGFCPQCGKPIQQSDRFCPRCGTPLQQEEEHAS